MLYASTTFSRDWRRPRWPNCGFGKIQRLWSTHVPTHAQHAHLFLHQVSSYLKITARQNHETAHQTSWLWQNTQLGAWFLVLRTLTCQGVQPRHFFCWVWLGNDSCARAKAERITCYLVTSRTIHQIGTQVQGFKVFIAFWESPVFLLLQLQNKPKNVLSTADPCLCNSPPPTAVSISFLCRGRKKDR